MSDTTVLDLPGCAALLGVRKRRLRRLARSGAFAPPAALDGGPTGWSDRDVLRWAAEQGPPWAGRAPVAFWPDATQPAEYLGAHRIPRPGTAYGSAGADDVVLSWAAPSGRVAVVWRLNDPIMLSLTDTARDIAADVLVTVDPGLGDDGPALRAISTAHPTRQYTPAWSDLARVLGQPMPYWPLELRDPDLISAWHPGAAPAVAPARPDLDTAPLLRAATLFPPEHPSYRTLLTLARSAHHTATRRALADLEALHHCLDGAAARTPTVPDTAGPASTVVAAEPMTVDLDHAEDEISATDRRIGWHELLERSDTLSWQCVREALRWDNGRDLPFSSTAEIDTSTATGREWIARLQPTAGRTAHFAVLHRPTDAAATTAYTDPLSGAPAVRRGNGRVLTAVPRHLPAGPELAELILDDPIWVRTTDGALHLAPSDPGNHPGWGYHGSGPTTLAATIDHLLTDITAVTGGHVTDGRRRGEGVSAGLRALTQLGWPRGTVLPRDLLDAARDGRPYDHPDAPRPR